jgi:electron transfer flavoprotein alpha subunit
MSQVLVVIEHDRGEVADTAYQAIGFARSLVGAEADGLAGGLGAYGVTSVVQVHHADLSDYAPEAWGDAVAQVAASLSAVAVVATGTDRGNEVLAHVAAVADHAFAANVLEAGERSAAGLFLTRVRWGGSLLEKSALNDSVFVMSCAAHTFSAEPVGGADPSVSVFEPTLANAGRTRITDRVTLASGITLTTAAIVVSGGRGVGSADGFAPLEELAELLGGAVGCSRVATNNGWRPHSDQVGQTGKRIAPELYIACGISGAIQHWVGMMAAKKVLAINTDGEANMVGKADYAVMGDLHKIIPAVSAEIRRRRG